MSVLFGARSFPATISVPLDLSPLPSDCISDVDGPARFHQILRDLLNRHDRVRIILDGAIGYSSPFLAQAFGGLLYYGILTRETARNRLIIVGDDPGGYREEALRYLGLTLADCREPPHLRWLRYTWSV